MSSATNTIAANNDAGSVTSAAGGQAVANVLVNDTLGGAGATTSNVTITPVGSLPSGITLDTADGSVDVAAGTAAGTYTFDYQICETAAPANCDTATVTVTVTATTNPIVATNDSGGVTSAAGGQAVANVLVNDTLAGSGATTSTVTITPVGSLPSGITLDTADGSVDVVAGTAAGTYTFDYQICETAAPANCDTATVTVTVTGSGGGNAIVANNDTGGVTSASGGTAVANVLANDSLAGGAVTTSDVTISVGSTPSGISLNTSNGQVDVAAGTAPGTYTFDYTICEIASPSNCDTATVTITVTGSTGGGNAIVANDDAGGVTSASGGVAVANVLVNDTFDGALATPATVTIAVVGSLPSGISLNTSNGQVDVAAGTAPGTYTFDYQICETAAPANCDTATVTITVTGTGANSIVAANDSGGVTSAAGGQAVANVLANDTLAGAGATIANVTITPVGSLPSGITLDTADGSVDVAAGTAAGTYTFDYQICETSSPSNCDTATVTITVTGTGGNPIVATNDSGGVTSVSGGTAVPNVLANDTLSGGATSTADVTISPVGSLPAGITLNTTTGAVVVAAGTAAGTYTFDYRICEIAFPSNCDTATVTITVTGTGGNPIVATNDSGGVTSASGGTAVANVLANDTLSGGGVTTADVTLSTVGAMPSGITLNTATGAVTVAAGTAPGTYTFTYRICETAAPTNCDTATVTVTVTGSGGGGSPPPPPPPPPPAKANLSVTKSGPTSAKQGETITFTLTVRNAGPNAATDVVIKDTLPTGLSAVPGSASIGGGGSCTISGNTVTCTLASLAAGATVEITLRATVTGSSGTVINQASVVSSTSDPDGRDNATSWEVKITPKSGTSPKPKPKPKPRPAKTTLGLKKIALVSGPVKPGQTYRYRITVTNTGKNTALDVVVCDVPSRKLVFVSAPGASFSKGRACWKIDRLAPGASKSYVITVRLDTNAKPGRVRNDAIASASNTGRRQVVRSIAHVRVKGRAAGGRPGGVTG
ncbi:MAG: isopeptide-forming domain-containing fimbrial protein [Gaiella sp.]